MTSSGYVPSRIAVEKGKPVRMAFHRSDSRNCADIVVLPQLRIRRLSVGETVRIEFTPAEAGELAFTCGMAMYSGAVAVR